MQKFNKRIFFVMILVLFFVPKNIFALTEGRINSDNINLLTAPSSESAVLKKLSIGQAVEILDSKSLGSGFYKIGVDGIEAYSQGKFVDIIESDGIVSADNVNIRALPYCDAQVIAKANSGDILNINAIVDDWFVISYKNNKAYINKRFVFCEFENKLQKVNMPERKFAIIMSDNGLNLREGKSIESNNIGSLPRDYVVDIIQDEKSDKDGNWIKVAFENNFGYINSDYVKIADSKPDNKNNDDNNKNDEQEQKNNSLAKKIVEFAKKFLGTPYRFGGKNLNKGVDCSGFVYCVMKSFGINLNSSSRTQVKNGHEVQKANLSAGDLVFFSNYGRGKIEHVGMYIGDNKFIHSASGNKGCVTISSLNENYYLKNYITARRVI